jgi:putative phosphoribosyl transferase
MGKGWVPSLMNSELTPQTTCRTVSVSTSTAQLTGDLVVPAGAQGVVLLVQGINNSPPPKQYLAKLLHQASLATLMIELLTPDEVTFDQRTRQLRFDAAGLLADRVVGATDWLLHTPATQHLSIGYFGDGTAGAAILAAAAKRSSVVKAIVSRGGWLDLIWSTLTQVHAPTLLIVGGLDLPIVTVNEEAIFLMDQASETCLDVIPGASHRFVESDTLEQAEVRASEWFQRFLHP